jgi:hypothetical protein
MAIVVFKRLSLIVSASHRTTLACHCPAMRGVRQRDPAAGPRRRDAVRQPYNVRADAVLESTSWTTCP